MYIHLTYYSGDRSLIENIGKMQHADITGDKIAPRRDVKQTDFSDVWWVGDRADGGLVAVKVYNSLSTGGLTLTTGKNAKGQIAITLTGHVSLADQTKMPMEFYSMDPEP